MSESAKKRCTPEWRKMMSDRYSVNLPLQEVIKMYESWMTQYEIWDYFWVTQRIVFWFMRRNWIEARVWKHKDQNKEKNTHWKGDNAWYKALHYRVTNARWKANKCQICEWEHTRYEWANINWRYEDINDYVMMCKTCHARMDLTNKYEWIKQKAQILLNI